LLDETIEPTQEEIEIAQQLSDFQEEFGGKDYHVRVERYIKEDSEWEILPQIFKLDGFDPTTQLKPYGGGRFRLTPLNEKKKYVKSNGDRIYFRMAEFPRDAEPVQEQRKSALEDPIVQMMIENSRADKLAFMELLRTMVAKPVEQPKGPGMTELIESLAKLKTLGPTDDGGFKNMKQALEFMTAMKALMPEPAEPSGEGFMSELSQAVKVAGDMGLLNRRGAGAPQEAKPSAAISPGVQPRGVMGHSTVPPAITHNPVPTENKPVEEKNPIIEGVREYVPTFVKWARRAEEIEVASDFLVGELTSEIIPLIVKHYRPGGLTLSQDFVLQKLVDYSQDPKEVEKIYDFAPELSEFKPWVNAVIAESVKQITTVEAEPPEGTDPETNGAEKV
jgi:hypothetical protein